jgi:phosphomethylpyrimidine synthase
MPDDLSAPIPLSVTTGPITGSRKSYSAPDGCPDLRVPFREIPLDPSAREEPVRVYDTSGHPSANIGSRRAASRP